MEPQEIYCCKEPKKDCGKRIKCLGVIAVILSILFLGVIGAIIGANIAGRILEAISAVIVLAIVLGTLLILSIILLICNCVRRIC